MYSNTPSVSKAIKDILFSNSIYTNSLKMGIASYTALAIKIKPEVDRIIGSEVNINTIVVSIKRIADALLQLNQYDSIAKEEKENLAGARISLTGSILDVEFDKEMENIEKVLDLFDSQSDIRFNIFQSKNHMNLFIENISEIKKIFNSNDDSPPTINPSKIKEGVSMITISLPWGEEKELRKTYQLLSMISNILYDNQISLHNAFFTPNEIVLIINDRDAAKVYELLRVKF